jgi:hypothetical protein
MLMGSLRMLLCGGSMFLPLYVVALTVVFRSGPMCFGCVLMMLRSLVVFVFRHGRFLVCAPSSDQSDDTQIVPLATSQEAEIHLTSALKNALPFALTESQRSV